MTAVTKTRRCWQPFDWLSSVALSSAALSPAVLRSAALRLVPSTLHSFTLHRIFAAVVLLSFTWSITSTLAVFPHELSYFNELVGGPLNGSDHLLDANIDWGQDLLELKHWYDAHLDARPIDVAYCGLVDQRIIRVPRKPAHKSEVAAHWCAVSTNDLYAYQQSGGEIDQWSWLRRAAPVARAGYSISIFRAPYNVPR